MRFGWNKAFDALGYYLTQFAAAFPERLLAFLERHAYIAAFVLLFLEESGVPLPVPGDSVMLLSGYLVYQGKLNPVLAFLCLEFGTLGGATVLYFVARFAGARLLARFGRYIRLTEERVAKAEVWLREKGGIGIILGRIIPGLRIPTSVVAGTLRMPFREFILYAAIGSSLYVLTFFVLGWVLGQQTPALLRAWRRVPVHPALILISILALLVVAAVLLWYYRGRRKPGGPPTGDDQQPPDQL